MLRWLSLFWNRVNYCLFIFRIIVNCFLFLNHVINVRLQRNFLDILLKIKQHKNNSQQIRNKNVLYHNDLGVLFSIESSLSQ